MIKNRTEYYPKQPIYMWSDVNVCFFFSLDYWFADDFIGCLYYHVVDQKQQRTSLYKYI